jgi:peptide/nickel transport system substrate-binding protein
MVKRFEVLGVLAASTMMPACTRIAGAGGDSGNRAASTIPHELRYSDGEDPVGLNPLSNVHASTAWLAELWGAWLFRTSSSFEPVPELCTEIPTVANGLLSPDGRRITYKLRDATWSDGTPFTSHDVAFSVALINDPNTIVETREGWELIERVETPDERTAIFHLRSTFSAWAATFFSTGGANPCILPKHIVASQNANTGAYNAKPIGTGPFVIDAWLRGQSVELSANPHYWRGLPKLQRIVYQIIPDDETLMTRLRAREIDLWMQMNPTKLAEASAIPGVEVLRKPSVYWWHIDCNCAQPALAEINVRQALNHAIDRKTIIDKVLHGAGDLNWSVISPVSFAYNGAVKQYPYDLARANALLDAAGWRRGPNGVRSKNGLELHFTMAYGAGNATWAQMLELIRASWSQIGVTFDLKAYQTNLYFAPFQNGGIVQAGKFDLCAFQWGHTANPTGVINLYAADRIPPHGQNDLRYRNAEVTQLLHDATQTLDRGRQRALLQRAQAAIAEDCPTFPIAQSVALYPASTDLKKFDPNSLSPFDFMLEVDI